ncbi:methenyltetrahydrofolate synthase domain-containing protein isoform X1 [Apus apus]|uniref:methenyltetrahydrofolate synthase domain-containing protein isoform X1 n=1 Tax=Apus apus TaxID=8895 RepID=UPI0021F8A531|nr:methenyltetrahydrofolate synthase domain-containing protein isoform X1 [Apus apus]
MAGGRARPRDGGPGRAALPPRPLPARPGPAPPAGASKQQVRRKVWDYLESSGLAEFPRPVHGRIPSFKGSHQACCSVKELDVFKRASEVKVDPDKPLEGVRLAVLQARKTLLVPTPRLRTGLFNRIVPPSGASKEILKICATSQGIKEFSVPVGLDGKARVDLVVVGSVAVSEKGWRIGKGEGYADMEYAMMVSMGAVQEDTPVITIVHDCQVLDIAEELLGDHDLTVDYILTPTRTIKTHCKRPKPRGIIWHKVSYEMLEKIPILKSLRYREKQAGKDVTLQDEQSDLANANSVAAVNEKVVAENSRPQAAMGLAQPGQHHVGSASLSPRLEGSGMITTVYVGNIPPSVRVSELKSALREFHATPFRLNWQGAQHRAFLDYKDKATAESAVSSLKGLSLGGNTWRVELAKNQRNKRQVEINSQK